MAISALLKSASATRAKIQAANDAQVAYEWTSSAQTYDDYIAYKSYLENAVTTVTDPTSQLSYQTKIRSALSSYTSNEIQRQGQAVMEGRSTIQDKMGAVEALYGQAVTNGDMNLAQNLISTWDSLSVQQQNQAQADLAASRANASANATAFKNSVADTLDQYKNIQKTFVNAFTSATNPQEQAQNIAKINANLPPNLQVDPTAGIFDIVASIGNAIVGDNGILQQAIQLAPDDAARRTYQEQYNKYVEGTTPIVSLPSATGKSINLTMGDIQKQVAAANVGETIYSPVAGANGTVWTENKLANYTFGRDAGGNTVAIPTYSTGGQNLAAKVTDFEGNPIYLTGKNGKPITQNGQKQQATYADLLKQAGFNVSESNGALMVNDPTGSGRLNGNNTVQAYLDSNGQLQFADNANNIFQVNFDKNGQFTGTGKEIPSPFITVNSDGSKNANSPYFQANPNQYAETVGTAGLLTPQTVAQFDRNVGINSNPILSGGGFSNQGVPSRFSSPANLLQGAQIMPSVAGAIPGANIQAPQIAVAPIAQIQAPSLNPQQISSRANITVAKPAAPAATISTKSVNNNPNVSVQKKAPTFNIRF